MLSLVRWVEARLHSQSPLSPREPMLSLESCVGVVLRSDPIAKAPWSPREPAYRGCPYKPHFAECHEWS
ncbi:unnamed protein product [Staurois parvus]|uniref:Uncharacterized protein n=1 Tax=Staurois parvus TaxID=386267 RepID=A0ABN9FAJ1_9NEOB|nr:unnamed protein product [Staurois parvus]